MTRPNEREYDERYEDDHGARGEDRPRQPREQSERGPYQRSGELRAQLGARNIDRRWEREERGWGSDQERGFTQSSERGYDRGGYSQPGYAQRNYDENSFHRAGYDRGQPQQFGQTGFERSNWQQSGQGQYGNDPDQRYGGSIRSEWSNVNDSRGGWSRPSSLRSDYGERTGGFFGKGPKGYTRSDDRIREDVCDRLSADDELDASEITVTVSGGEVTLEGTVPDRRSKHRAEDLSDAISGVADVHNRLRAQRGLVKEVSDKLLGREEPQPGHHAGSGTRNNPAGSSVSSTPRTTAVASSSNESLNHR